MATIEALRQAADAWNAQRLNDLKGLRQRSPTHGYFPPGIGPYGDRQQSLATMMGGYDTSPDAGPITDTMFSDYAARVGGNPYQQQLNAIYAQQPGNSLYYGPGGGMNQPGGAGAPIGQPTGPRVPAPPAGPDMFTQAYQSALADNQRARDENLKRYDEVKGMYGDLATRNQEKVGNWGKVQEQLNAEKSQQALGSEQAYLASRGLSNSTILPAFQQRNARDLALTQQDLSERRDNRSLQYDSADTERLGSFIERRNDTGPDMNQLMQLALEYGRSGDGEGLRSVQDQINQLQQQLQTQQSGGGYQPLTQLPGGGSGGFSPFRAAQYQAMVNGAYGGVNGPFTQPQGQQVAYYDGAQFDQPSAPQQFTPDQLAAMNERARRGGYRLNSKYRQSPYFVNAPQSFQRPNTVRGDEFL